MPTKRVFEIESRLDKVFCSTGKITDDEIKSHLSRYLCVLTSGYIEESFKIIIQEYVKKRANLNISNYIISSSKQITNLNSEKIGVILNYFNSGWKDNFETEITEEEKDAINSVLANRNLIAHGNNVGVSFVNVSTWYKYTKSVVLKIKNIVII